MSICCDHSELPCWWRWAILTPCRWREKGRERKIRRDVVTSSIKRLIRKLSRRIRVGTAFTKKTCCKIVVLLIKPIEFLTFSLLLLSPSLLLKLSSDYNQGLVEWFSFECRKTKTKVITLANHIGHRQYIEPIKTRSNYMWLTQSAGKSCERVTIGFGFTSDWMKRWRESFKPIASCRKCKTNYFSTLKWKPL